MPVIRRSARSSATARLATTLVKPPISPADSSVVHTVSAVARTASAVSGTTSTEGSSSAGSCEGPASKSKRYRERVDGELEKLMELWDRNQYPSRQERLGLANELGM